MMMMMMMMMMIKDNARKETLILPFVFATAVPHTS